MNRSIFSFVTLVLLLSVVATAAENPIVVGRTARFTIITPGCIRMEFSESGTFIDERSLFAVNRDARTNEFTLTTTDTSTTIETPKMTLRYRSDGKKFSAENLEIRVTAVKGEYRWTPDIPNTRNLGGTNRTLDGVAGEVPLEDGLLSRNGWYLHDDSRRPLMTQDWEKQRSLSAGTDWYFFAYGTDYRAALKDLAVIGGKIPLPRKYLLGSWYSRYWPYSSAEYREIVDQYEKNDFPLDVMVMDMDWHKDGWTGWSWNRKLLPDAEALLKWFHEKKLFVTLNLHPADGVGPQEDTYKKFMTDMGVDLSKHPDSVIAFDAANKKYMETLFRDTHDPLEGEGVDFWWIDWQQTEKTRSNPELNNLEWLNQLYFKQTGRKTERGTSFSRWGGWGNHRYPINFSGDASTRWPMLEFEVPFTTTAGNVGCFFWSHDIGGHMGGFFPETNCRWNQFGVVSAALRLHSTRDATMDKRPWIRDSIYTVSQRIAFHLRSELFPYIYSSAWRSVSDMTPLTAPMYIEYADKEIAYQVPQEYMFGPALLAAPITTAGIGPKKIASQQIWFPDGVWYNWFTGEKFTGADNFVSVLADINEFPLYAKAGVPVTLQPYTQRMATEPLKELVIRTFPGPDSSETAVTLYEDDGVSKEYEAGRHATTTIAYKRVGDRHEIMITPAEGDFTGQVKARSYIVEFPCTMVSHKAMVNGVVTEPVYDERLLTNRITTGVYPVSEEVLIQLEAADADPSIERTRASTRRFSGMIGTKVPSSFHFDAASIAEIKKKVPADQVDLAIALIGGLNFKFKNDRVEVIKSADSHVSSQLEVRLEDISGRKTQTLLKREFPLANGTRIAFPIVESPVEHLGLTTSRYLSLSYLIDGKRYSAREKISEKTSAIKHWNLVGPFPFDIRKSIADVVYAPEQDRLFDAGKSYAGSVGVPVRWQHATSGPDDVVDLGRMLNSTDAIAYALVYLKSDRRQAVRFFANSDDGIEMFVNNTKIHSHNVMRGVEAATDTVDAMLQNGVNTLLVKISQGSGGWAFRIKVEAPYGLESSVTQFK
jgi:alpha-glucosidase (family GH31 glycosyl hydrolase)